ncbi:hypothetical protein M0813_09941 [Anaeramoeba flamelloides]|uniref:BTB domain-containing protein n=1 Tax=Anaeramoeba flamelloides TaxID=1746091 RepID=A0ABQ8X558_9EUKA|nr:hypothetical protein M0813_09941 [Anaeramoeba flamelloides]
MKTQTWILGNNIYGQVEPKHKNMVGKFKKTICEHEFVKISGTHNEILSVTRDNQLISVGKNPFTVTSLGDNNEKDNEDPITQLSCGYGHSFILTESGRVFCFGNSSFYQLGNQTFQRKPILNRALEAIKSKIIQISSGEFYSIFLCENGDLYGVGDNKSFQIDPNPKTINKKVDTTWKSLVKEPQLISQDVIMINEGLSTRHLFYITSNGTIWCSGSNKFGQCGIGSQEEKIRHHTIGNFDHNQIKQITCGFESSFVLLNNSDLYSCGNNERNGHSKPILVFTKLDYFNNIAIEKISTGSRHTLVLSQEGEVYAFGQKYNGLTFGPTPHKIKIPDYDYSNPISISACVYNAVIYTVQMSTLGTDFKNFYKSHEFTDVEINGIKLHKLFIELRLGCKIEKIQEILKEFSQEDTDNFFLWVYSGFSSNSNNLRSICGKFGIDDLKEKQLKKNLLQLYKDEDSKDFFIQIKEEMDDENEDFNEGEDEDEDEEEFEEIPVHRFILLARSGLFREMFRNVKTPTNKVKDYSQKTLESLEILFEYFYTDVIKLTADHDPQLIYEELQDAIEYYQLHKYSSLNFELQKLKKKN